MKNEELRAEHPSGFTLHSALRTPHSADSSVLTACRQTLAVPPAALLVDLDGTISPIALTPSEARVTPGCREALERLVGQLAFVGILSGRVPQEARALVGIESLAYLGVHGMVRWTDAGPEAHPEAAAFVRVVARVLPQLARRLNLPGVRLEPKGPVVAVHYRQAEDLEDTRQTILRELGRIAERTGLAVLEGRRVVELRPPRLGKGWCVEQLVAERPFSGIVCIGDDKTDAEAFRAVAAWREGAPERQAVTVGVANPEIPALSSVEGSSWEPDFVVGGVHAVERLLLSLSE